MVPALSQALALLGLVCVGLVLGLLSLRGVAVITLPELLADKQYREYFVTRPAMPKNMPAERKPWRIYVQRQLGGPWARREFHTYVEAFKFLKPMLPKIHDAALQSKGIAFEPPIKVVRLTRGGKPLLDEKKRPRLKRIVWTPTLPPDETSLHRWCPYCRRPTVFGWFSRHHAFPKGYEIATPYQRCTICGSSERLLNGVIH